MPLLLEVSLGTWLGWTIIVSLIYKVIGLLLFLMCGSYTCGFWFVSHLGPAVTRKSELYFASSTYVPFTPYALNEELLEYWPRCTGVDWDIGELLTVIRSWSSFSLHNVPTGLIVLGETLRLQNKYLYIDEAVRLGSGNMALPRLLPQLLL